MQISEGRLQIVAALLIAGLCPAALLAQTPARDTPAPAGTAVIRGRVTAAAAERPLSRVEVRANCPPLKVNKAVLTGADGRYEITDLPAGRYTVGFSRTNYVRASFGQRRPLGAGAPIDVASGQVVSRIDAALQLAGIVTGRVVDEFGDPAVNVRVSPMRFQFINGERRIQQAGGGGTTNDIGEYRMYGLLPGQYFVSATAQANQGGDAGSATDRTGYAPTYFPGTGNIAEAQRIAVAAGQTLTGMNMTLLPVVAVRVSGVALDGRGRPMAGASMNLMRRVGLGMSGSSFAQVRPDGTFRFGGVTPGDYSLRASLPGAQDEFATAEITVTTGDVSDVQVVVVKPSTLRGRVVFEPGDAKPPAFTALRISLSHTNFTGTSSSDTPKDTGAFEIRASAGHAVIRAAVFNSPDWRLKRVLTAYGADVTDDGFDLPANATVEGLVVELTSRYAEASGTVVDAAGAAVRDCIVVAFAQDPLRWGAMTRYVAVSRPDQDNVFHLRLTPGDYYVAAFELDDPSNSVTDPDILQQLRERATTLSIAAGEKHLLPLRLSEPPIF